VSPHFYLNKEGIQALYVGYLENMMKIYILPNANFLSWVSFENWDDLGCKIFNAQVRKGAM
jgi:hypothetical protein